MAQGYEYFVDLVLVAPLDVPALGANATDLGHRGFRLVGTSPIVDAERGACLLLFWERLAEQAPSSSAERDVGGGTGE